MPKYASAAVSRTAGTFANKPVKKITIDLGRYPDKKPLVKLYQSIEGVVIRRRRNNIVEITIPQSTFVGSRRAMVSSQQASSPLYKKRKTIKFE